LLDSTFVQPLERRVLLDSSDPFDVSKIPTFTPTSGSLTDLKHGPFAKAGGIIASVYTEYRKYANRGGAPLSFKSAAASTVAFNGASVGLTLRTRGTIQQLQSEIEAVGGRIVASDANLHVVDAYVPVWNLNTLISSSSVATAKAILRPHTNAAGIATNFADQGEAADAMRAAFGLTGKGVKVGVISDSFGDPSGSEFTGDLPSNVQVIQDTSGTDEGRAMLELIHDLAPKASLAFATAEFSQLNFAHNIINLADAGAKVIVDDIGYVDEPMFQNGIISQAIGAAKHQYGVNYLSAAGNQSNNGWLQKINWVTDSNGQTLVDFDPSDAVSTKMEVRLNATPTTGLVFEWDDPFNGLVGSTGVDLDVLFYDHTTGILLTDFTFPYQRTGAIRNLIEGGIDDNIATQQPLENIRFPTGGAFDLDVEIKVADRLSNTPLPQYYEFQLTQDAELPFIQYPLDRVGLYGHAASNDAISVGAVPFISTPAFSSNSTIANEPFSSVGPNTYLFTTNGERRDTPLTLLKPDLSGVDNVNTSFFGTDVGYDNDVLRNFPGTSAAAPNVAAVAALLRELAPSATPDQIQNALIQSAKLHPLNGSKSGTWDPRGGFGLVDGLEAAHILSPNSPIVRIQNVLPAGQPQAPRVITISFNEPVSGFDLSDLSLTRGKDGLNLLPSSKKVKLTTIDHKTYYLKNLGAVAGKIGNYHLTVNAGSSTGIVDADGHSALGAARVFSVTGQPTNVQAVPVRSNEIDLIWTDNTTNESGFKVTRALDKGFTLGVTTFTAAANSNIFRDTTVGSSTRFFYKVTPITKNSTPDATSTSAAAVSLAPGEVVVDNTIKKDVEINGSWKRSSSGAGFFGRDYLLSGKKGGSVTFMPDLPANGEYFVYARLVRGVGAKPGDISVGGQSASMPELTKKNKSSMSGWVLLGKFALNAGKKSDVTIAAGGQPVAADAVRFQLADAGSLPSAQSRSVSSLGASSHFSSTLVAQIESPKDLLAL
jgi:hypothetical protein